MHPEAPASLQIGQNRNERRLAAVAIRLRRSNAAWVGWSLLKAVRLAWRGRSMRAEHGTTGGTPLPTGPFERTRRKHVGDLLLWVPRAIDSFLIDDLTGGFGYSHATIDMGEIDLPTRKPVMAEITVHQKVARKFQDEYGARPSVRLPLAAAGVDVERLASCVNSKMGEQYDFWDVLTLGEIHDPAREVCSGLVADCLPQSELEAIARAKRLGLLRRHSVSLHSRLQAPHVKAFVSPNGLAEYYGAPEGRKVRTPDTLVEPRPVDSSMTRLAGAAAKRHGWKAVVVAGAILTVGLALMKRKGK